MNSPSCPRVRRGFEECACAHSSRRTPDAMQRGGTGGVSRSDGVVGVLLVASQIIPARLRLACRGAAPEPVTFPLLAQRESHQRERAPRFAAASSFPGAVSLRCSTSPAVCATRAPTRLLQVPQARVVDYPFSVYPTRPVLARRHGSRLVTPKGRRQPNAL